MCIPSLSLCVSWPATDTSDFVIVNTWKDISLGYILRNRIAKTSSLEDFLQYVFRCDLQKNIGLAYFILQHCIQKQHNLSGGFQNQLPQQNMVTLFQSKWTLFYNDTRALYVFIEQSLCTRSVFLKWDFPNYVEILTILASIYLESQWK